MLQISVAQLYEANLDKLALTWVAGRAGADAVIRQDPTESAAFVGHLNLIHPNRIQVLGKHEQAHLEALDTEQLRPLIERCIAAEPAAILLADDVPGHPLLRDFAESRGIALWASPQPAAVLIDKLRRHLSKALAETVSRHGVFMDVLGVGVLITGDSGVGKSELGLELISRGHGLVADDVVEISRIAASTLVGRAPAMLKDFLEVRGLGVLNIRTIFGEAAVRPKMNVHLIVHLARPQQPGGTTVERLPLHELSEDILGVTVRKVVIPVAAGRNLAVLIEAAVRNYILQLRGYNSTEEFIRRQRLAMDADG
ncbi:MAG: HPr(Ser) kinase/phosphatase [Pseudomonadota bacterium]|nr:MAG: HPr kinase/phosphorylase [Pseudomonadota bacterium]